jgi:hypothetical protein
MVIFKAIGITMLSTVLPRVTVPRINASTNTHAAVPHDLICGIDAVRACGAEHGIVGSHLSILSDLATRDDVVFGFRPVNSLATQLLEQGYPTKNLHIKGKSADWGPMAGFIPVQQKLSKLAGVENEFKKIKKSDAEVSGCIEKGHAVSMPLAINKARLDMLLAGKAITTIKKNNEGVDITVTKDGFIHEFTGKLSGSTAAPEYAISHLGKPVHVLATPSGGEQEPRPMTADYDLLLFAVPLDQLSSQDSYRDPIASNHKEPSASGRVLSAKLVQVSKNNKTKLSLNKENRSATENSDKGKSKALRISTEAIKSDSDLGIISPRLKKFIPEINKALGRTSDNDIVQHGADTQNPYSELTENYPSVIFLPKRLEPFRGVVMVRNKEESIQIFKAIKDSGFQFFGNNIWEKAMPAKVFRRSSFDAARRILQNNPLLERVDF